ncbi:hypothetical protein LXL04_023298 [Taraxacum kok-saghyz]
MFDSSIGPVTKTYETGRVVGPSRVQIRETTNGGITLVCVTEAEVTSHFISVATCYLFVVQMGGEHKYE